MNTWESFLAKLREDLQDTSTDKPRWSDKLLWMYTCDGIRDYSQYFPMRVNRTKVTLAETGDGYTLPTNYLEQISVECPENRFLIHRQETPGKRYPVKTSSLATLYYVSGGYLYLNGSDMGEDVLLSYSAVHSLPEDESDISFEFTFPDQDEELIRLYVRAQVYGQMRSKTSRLDRFDQGTGRRDDNPLTPETQNLMDEYHAKLMTRIPIQFISLFRVGRRR